jgi:hypothetical protein
MANLWEGSGQVLVDGTGTPYASWKLYSFDTGTTSNKATYSDAGLTSANTNPVVADSNGRMGDVYLLAGRYKLVFKTSADVTIKTIDPYDSSSQLITATASPSPTYSLMEYVNSTDSHRYRRSLDNTTWIDLGLANSLGNSATVAQILAGTDTTSFGTPDSIAALWQRGTDIASATTLSLPSTGGRVFNITGTTTITGIGSAVGGTCIKLKFVGACALTNNVTSFIIPGGSLTTAAGDTAEFINEAAADATGSNWRCFDYQRASGSPINIADLAATQANQETATSTTTIVTPGRQQYHPSSAKGWVNWNTVTSSTITASYNVSSLTDNGVGDTSINWTTAFSAAASAAIAGFAKADGAENAGGTIRMDDGVPATLMSTTLVRLASQGNTNTKYDTDLQSMLAFGDQ